MTKIGLFHMEASIRCFKKLVLNHEIAGTYFSKQQTKCLKLLVRGKTAKMIASELKISPRTVESHIEQIKFKLNVRSKAELIDKAIEYFLALSV